MIEVGDRQYAGGEIVLGNTSVSASMHLADAALQIGTAFFAPHVSIARSVTELYTGRNMLTGEQLTGWQKGLEVVSICTIGVGGGFIKTAEVLGELAVTEGKVAKVAGAWLKEVEAADEAARLMRAEPSVEGTTIKLGARAEAMLDSEIHSVAGELPSVTETAINAALKTSQEPIGQITEGARALAKKLGHASAGGYRSAFQGTRPTQENAEHLIRSILQSPNRVVIADKGIDVYNRLGQGVRLNRITKRFITFLEEARATR
jgi:hypothetical protein